MQKHRGSCHCKRVQFSVRAHRDLTVFECNCSICRMTGFLHLIVRQSDFMLESGKDELTTYTFNTGVARHYFCRHCGIKSFYAPRSNPEGVSVNLRCLDPGSIASTIVKPFDGVNWEVHSGDLSHLTD